MELKYSVYKGQPIRGNEPINWRPKGILVSTLLEHKAAVRSLAVARDNTFVASG